MKEFQKTMARFAVLFLGLLILGFAACSTDSDSDDNSAPTVDSLVPGEYVKTATGFTGQSYDVTVTVIEDEILDIEVSDISKVGSEQVGQAAASALIEDILKAQTAGVDIVGGATITTSSLKAAVDAALVEAGASSNFISPPKTQAKGTVIVDADIVVIGSGVAGLSAAVQAKAVKSTANVIILEKMEIIGGSTKLAAGVVYGAETDDQTGYDELAEFYMERAQGYADENLVKYFAKESINTLNFLGMDPFPPPSPWGPPDAPNGNMSSGTASAARMRMDFTMGGGAGLVNRLVGRLPANTIRTGVKATDLIVTGGKVTGVKAESKKSNYIFNAKAVVIATGGFDSDFTGLMATYNADSKNDVPQSSSQNVGDGIKMAQKIGAATVFKGGKIGWVGIDNSLGEAMHYSSVVVKQDGEVLPWAPRPAGKSSDGKFDLLPGYYEQSEDDYAVVHNRMVEARKNGATAFWAITNGPSQYPDFAHTSDSISGLATLIGADVDKLTAAFATKGPMKTITETGSVFTATKAIPSSIGSMGGIKINTKAEVLKADGTVISGLYAAGETANGDFFYQEYPGSGSSLAIGATMGRTAGKQAAGKLE
ncbi:FAD-dependent oxidoreductase [Leadbettera azotonutricia]|uniref:Fumarate reductase/succinate dehydrogenase flavoprotein domain protein n=1 Tax=Leadbettera azotonutricia (strain ATCC BAA-888 / DSM 13862 / ZAS-9) TaxID=545695 RepID=F5YBV0_LEAAZ|nr:FAD-dependent oxidoreductase [Leadbettera azotonutricia]AEF80491.1 fumarate reductase/succinate dehydrogenase flavoprotein domain protein [Leadbettera azotonutricia ZAS-9]